MCSLSSCTLSLFLVHALLAYWREKGEAGAISRPLGALLSLSLSRVCVCVSLSLVYDSVATETTEEGAKPKDPSLV